MLTLSGFLFKGLRRGELETRSPLSI